MGLLGSSLVVLFLCSFALGGTNAVSFCPVDDVRVAIAQAEVVFSGRLLEATKTEAPFDDFLSTDSKGASLTQSTLETSGCSGCLLRSKEIP